MDSTVRSRPRPPSVDAEKDEERSRRWVHDTFLPLMFVARTTWSSSPSIRAFVFREEILRHVNSSFS